MWEACPVLWGGEPVVVCVLHFLSPPPRVPMFGPGEGTRGGREWTVRGGGFFLVFVCAEGEGEGAIILSCLVRSPPPSCAHGPPRKGHPLRRSVAHAGHLPCGT